MPKGVKRESGWQCNDCSTTFGTRREYREHRVEVHAHASRGVKRERSSTKSQPKSKRSATPMDREMARAASRKKTAQETPERRERRLAADRARRKARLDAETPEEKEARLVRDRAMAKLRREAKAAERAEKQAAERANLPPEQQAWHVANPQAAAQIFSMFSQPQPAHMVWQHASPVDTPLQHAAHAMAAQQMAAQPMAAQPMAPGDQLQQQNQQHFPLEQDPRQQQMMQQHLEDAAHKQVHQHVMKPVHHQEAARRQLQLLQIERQKHQIHEYMKVAREHLSVAQRGETPQHQQQAQTYVDYITSLQQRLSQLEQAEAVIGARSSPGIHTGAEC